MLFFYLDRYLLKERGCVLRYLKGLMTPPAFAGRGSMTQAPENGTCPHLTQCPMFAQFDSQASGRIFRLFYCEGKYRDCLRFQKSERGESVSDNLLPNGKVIGA